MLHKPLVNQGPSAPPVVPGSSSSDSQHLTPCAVSYRFQVSPGVTNPCGGEETISVKYSAISSVRSRNGPKSEVLN